MIVRIPSPLLSYTKQVSQVEARGTTPAEILADLERQFPGIRFRVVDEAGRLRRHIKLFVGSQTTEDLDLPVGDAEVLHLVAALSGG